MTTTKTLLILSTAATLAAAAPASADTVTTATGTAAEIRSSVDAFRAGIGPDNGFGPAVTGGRREVSSETVPGSAAAPALLTGDRFLSRGLRLSTPGSGLMVSAGPVDASGLPLRFGNLNPTYTRAFGAFSPERILAPIGADSTRAEIVVPGTTTQASTNGFGVVLTDVDRNTASALELFGPGGRGIRRVTVPAAAGNGRFSFVGVRLDPDERVSSVRILAGDTPVGPNDVSQGGSGDVAAIDDMILAEPQEVTEATVETRPTPEVAGAAVVVLGRRTGVGAASVRFRTEASGTATPNRDFLTISGTAVFAPGAQTARFAIPLLPDAEREGDETIAVSLGEAEGAVRFANSRVLVTITDAVVRAVPRAR